MSGINNLWNIIIEYLDVWSILIILYSSTKGLKRYFLKIHEDNAIVLFFNPLGPTQPESGRCNQ
jgi:hypothetical protein